MRKTLLMGLFSLALFATFTFAFTTNVSAAPLLRHTASSQVGNCNYPGNNSVIYLKAHANGKYVIADLNVGGGEFAPLFANSTNRDTWERFDYIVNPGGSISLRAHANGKYVTADPNSVGPLIADSPTISTWERFDWGCVTGNVLTLWAHANGTYVTADFTTSNAPLYAESSTVGTWQRFDWSFG